MIFILFRYRSNVYFTFLFVSIRNSNSLPSFDDVPFLFLTSCRFSRHYIFLIHFETKFYYIFNCIHQIIFINKCNVFFHYKDYLDQYLIKKYSETGAVVATKWSLKWQIVWFWIRSVELESGSFSVWKSHCGLIDCQIL